MGNEMISAATVCIVITLVGLSFRFWSFKSYKENKNFFSLFTIVYLMSGVDNSNI